MSTEYDKLMNWQKIYHDTVMNDLSTFPKLPKRGTIIAGPPGTGKTHATKFLSNSIRRDFPGLHLEVAATTGAAASRISDDAKTLATWLCLGLEAMKLHHKDEMIRLVNQRHPERLMKTDVLILDEVSMLSKRQFDNLNDLLRQVRHDPRPFGGIYVILIGDPFQLPPVPHDKGGGILRTYQEFVESCLENELDGFNYVVANEMKRSEGDKLLQTMLLCLISKDPEDHIRAMEILNENCYKGEMDIEDVLDEQERSGAIILSTAREGEYSVGAYNYSAEQRAKKLSTYKEIKIPAAKRLHQESDELLRNIGGKKGLEAEEAAINDRDGWTTNNSIPENAPCMIRMNMLTQEGIRVVNGDICHIQHINEETNCATVCLLKNSKLVTIPKVKFQSEWENQIGYEAFPFIPCAAMTVHKAQGATLENGIIFETRRIYNGEYMAHMLYTAFSRVKSISDLRITSYLAKDQLNSPLIKKRIEFIWKLSYMNDYLRPDMI
jgi:hypothetical protein